LYLVIKINSLPEGLEVGGDLELTGTNITSLPKGMKIADIVIM
jgi:hypothetical protein